MTDAIADKIMVSDEHKRGNRKKLTWLLILQGWTMLWVIIGHAPFTQPHTGMAIDGFWHDLATAMFRFAYSFHMPLFIMISGFLFNMTRIEKGWKYGATMKEKWIRLGIPYFIFITLALLLKIVMPSAVNREADYTVMGIVMNFLDPFNGALQEMWFVAVILWYFALFPIYPYILKNKTGLIAALLVSVSLFFIPMSGMTSFLAIDRAVHFFVFFYIGILVGRLNLNRYVAEYPAIIGASCVFIVSYLCHIPLLTPLAGSLSFWGLAIKVDKVLSNNIFASFRNYTYQIFLIGIFVQIAVKFLYAKIQFPGCYVVWWFICVLVGIYIPVILSHYVQKSDSKTLKMIMGL